MNKKTHNLLKPQIFLFFSEASSMYNQITSKMQIIQQHNKSKLKNTDTVKEIIVKGKI